MSPSNVTAAHRSAAKCSQGLGPLLLVAHQLRFTIGLRAAPRGIQGDGCCMPQSSNIGASFTLDHRRILTLDCASQRFLMGACVQL